MSKERAHRRAAREAERAAAAAAAERARAQAARRAAWSRLLPRRRARRPQRYGALPTQTKVQLVAGWLAVQLVLWQLVDATGTRLGLAVLTLALLPVLVVLTVNTSSRRSSHR
jgi:Flp pilus assembly protein TadB